MSSSFMTLLLTFLILAALAVVLDKLGDKAQPQGAEPTPAQLEQQHEQSYRNCFAGVIYPLMKANAAAIKLEKPGSFAQHDPGPGNRIRLENGALVLIYRFRRTSLVSGGFENPQIRYSNLPVKKIEGYLKPLLSSYAISAGFPEGDLHIEDRGAGWVELAVVFY